MRGKVVRRGKGNLYTDFFFCLFLSAMMYMSQQFKLCANTTFLSAVFFLTTRGLQGAYDCKVEGPV